MDIAYLLLLQNFREGVGGFLTPLMTFLSNLVISSFLIWAVTLIYWIFDKRVGRYLLMSLTVGDLVNQLCKLTACVYRPWIRDSRIVPANDMIRTATGYSFPSGHTQYAMAYYGAGAVSYWKRRRWLSVCLIVLLLLTGFSRNFLGVHTPQDVIVSLFLSGCVIYLVHRVRLLLEKKPQLDLAVAGAFTAFAALCLIYMLKKPYPMDYVDGVLLVDPQRMMHDGFSGIGSSLGFIWGWLWERRGIRFTADKTKPLTYVLAGFAFFPLNFFLGKLPAQLSPFIGVNPAMLVSRFLVGILVMALVPLGLKCVGAGRKLLVRFGKEQ